MLEKLDIDDGTEKESVDVCPLCGSSAATFMFWNFDRIYHLPGKFGTYSCDGCGMIRLSPRPTVKSIARYYPEDYGPYNTEVSINAVGSTNQTGIRGGIRDAVLSDLGYGEDRIAGWQKLLRPVLRRLFFERATYGYGEVFPEFVENGSALEIGCGNGGFLSFLKHHGWRVTGLDLSPFAAKQAKELFDIDVFNGTLEDAPFPAETFNFVRLSHVLEHFFDPLSSLRKVFSLLKPGGKAYIEVPNAVSYGVEAYDQQWYGWDAPRHLFMFSPETLRLTVEKAGLKITKLETAWWDFSEWSMTFKYEDELGEKLPKRPLVRKDDREKINADCIEGKQRFNANGKNGDLIRCWAYKPIG